MSRRLPFFVLLVSLGFVAPAQAEHGRAHPPVQGDAVLDAAQAQRRRDTLRESLKQPVDDRAEDPRRLSVQQKAELREQLRQQRSDLRK